MRFLKYFLTNVSGTVVDTVVLLALSCVLDSYAGLYLLAPVLAFQLAVLNNFTISYFWVWSDRVQRSGGDFLSRLLRYNASALTTFAGRLAAIALLGWLVELPVVLCNLLVLTVSGLFSYTAQDRLVFRAQPESAAG